MPPRAKGYKRPLPRATQPIDPARRSAAAGQLARSRRPGRRGLGARPPGTRCGCLCPLLLLQGLQRVELRRAEVRARRARHQQHRQLQPHLTRAQRLRSGDGLRGGRRDHVTVVDWVTRVVTHRYLRQKYRQGCACAGQPRIRTARAPAKVRARGAFSARLLARLCVEKFALARPANKVCQALRLEGVDLAPGTVSGLFQHTLHLLLPLGAEIHAYVRAQRHAHADETGYTVLDAEQHRRRWWLWVVAAEGAVAFLPDPQRCAEVLRTCYAWTGETPPTSPLLTLLTDALPTYARLVGWTRQALCWAHQRRRFRDVGRAHPALAPWAEQWRLCIVRLYQLHRDRRRAERGTPDWLQADAALRAHTAFLRAVLDQELAQADLHPDQRKALIHLQQRWTGYTAFLDEPLLPLDNNLAERLLRRAVLLRKNAFLIGADWAATCAALLWSVLTTAERNGLNPLTSLCAYFQACAENRGAPPAGRRRPGSLAALGALPAGQGRLVGAAATGPSGQPPSGRRGSGPADRPPAGQPGPLRPCPRGASPS
jgi:transposase